LYLLTLSVPLRCDLLASCIFSCRPLHCRSLSPLALSTFLCLRCTRPLLALRSLSLTLPSRVAYRLFAWLAPSPLVCPALAPYLDCPRPLLVCALPWSYCPPPFHALPSSLPSFPPPHTCNAFASCLR
jgi:hypothetical protein